MTHIADRLERANLVAALPKKRIAAYAAAANAVPKRSCAATQTPESAALAVLSRLSPDQRKAIVAAVETPTKESEAVKMGNA